MSSYQSPIAKKLDEASLAPTASSVSSDGGCETISALRPTRAATGSPDSPDHEEEEFSESETRFMDKLLERMKSTVDASLNEMSSKIDAVKSTVDASLNDMSSKMDATNEEIKKEIKNESKKVCGEIKGARKELSSLGKKMDILLEDKTRQVAAHKFGEDFGKAFVIESIHDVTKLLSNADTKLLPNGDDVARNRATGKLIAFVNLFLPNFLKAAIESVNKVLVKKEFNDPAFDDYKTNMNNIRQQIISSNADIDWSLMLGLTIQVVKDVSAIQLDGEDDESPDFQARVKAMTGRFKLKLERLKSTAEGNDVESRNSAGILLLAALAHAGEDILEKGQDSIIEWIEQKCNIFDYKLEIECDLTPMVTYSPRHENHVTITVGEIKSSINEYKKGCNQMIYTANVLQFGFWILFKDVYTDMEFITIGHLLIIEGNDDDQRLSPKVKDEITIHVTHCSKH